MHPYHLSQLLMLKLVVIHFGVNHFGALSDDNFYWVLNIAFTTAMYLDSVIIPAGNGE